MTAARTSRIKIEGTWYWYEIKESWSQLYYRFDEGKWYPTKKMAWAMKLTARVAPAPEDNR